MATPTQDAEAIRTRTSTSFDQIRNNTRISTTEARDQMARVLLDARQSMSALQQTAEGQTEQRQQSLERKLYGIGNSNDPSQAISYRDALDRAAAIPSDQERAAIELIKRSDTSGDTTLVRATLAVAYERGWVDVINTYGNAHPEQDNDLTELWGLQHGAFDQGLFAYTPPLAPSELAGAHDTQLRTWANGDY